MKRPLPDSEAAERQRREEAHRRRRRLAMIAILTGALALSAYLLLAGEMPDPPVWMRALWTGGRS